MNPYQTDVIGSDIKVMKHTDPTLVGLEGKAVDETKNVLTLETEKGQKMVPKTSGTLMINYQTANLEKMRFRPEDKMKKMRRKGKQ